MKLNATLNVLTLKALGNIYFVKIWYTVYWFVWKIIDISHRYKKKLKFRLKNIYFFKDNV